jgi:hypothetical protein
VDQALLFIESIEERIEIISLDGTEYLSMIRAGAAAGIMGGTIYDSLIGRCAIKANAARIYTWNAVHFQRLGPEIAGRVNTP